MQESTNSKEYHARSTSLHHNARSTALHHNVPLVLAPKKTSPDQLPSGLVAISLYVLLRDLAGVVGHAETTYAVSHPVQDPRPLLQGLGCRLSVVPYNIGQSQCRMPAASSQCKP